MKTYENLCNSMKIYGNRWAQRKLMKIMRIHWKSMEINFRALCLRSTGILLVFCWYPFGRNQKFYSQPTRQPANPPASPPASQPPGACVLYKENLPFSSIWCWIWPGPSKTDPFERRVLQQVSWNIAFFAVVGARRPCQRMALGLPLNCFKPKENL